ncbi:PLP-dependent transferase [Plenodomus tracheiphilus IPT5]|uniref:PLP-dependent transferase n=1 Tax=Plenodomus tracheiphilus IPT5 TaxID=1408161 RepID=A0A6A7B1T8_9PLEO|nr:PLP-dependent transferase [Plenodomus tracheiphilus IPT5]
MSNDILAAKTGDGVRFGKELREKEFLFDEGYLNLNHGSFGTYPRPILNTLQTHQLASESRPDHFIRYLYPTLLNQSRAALSPLLSAPASTLVFVPNATTGINTVLRNLTYQAGDYILYFDPIYGACEKTIVYVTETTEANSVKIGYKYPVEDEWLVSEFRRVVKDVESKGGRVKIAIFDTVVSMPGVKVPFEELISVSKELGVLSCVDGAHGVGHVELNLGRLDPDFFVSNCHKWLHVPRGCAVFYVPVRNQHLIRSTLPTSHGFQPKAMKIASPLPKAASADDSNSAFTANFEFVGTIDNSPYLCVPDAIKWREGLGGEAKIREYCTTLAQEGSKHVAKVLGTEIMDNSTKTLTQCCMANVRLPISVAKAKEVATKAGVEDGEIGQAVRDWLCKSSIDDHNTFIQCMFYDGAWWTRLSGQVYLDMADFEWAAETLQKLCARIEAGEWAAPEQK